MEFTGERYVPGAAGQEELYIEHMSRYQFAKTLVRGRRVLDVGSGCGYGTYQLAAGGAKVTIGIDKSVEAVEFSKRNYRHPNLFFGVMDAACLSLRSRFDLVTCFELIEHVGKAQAVLRGVYEVLDEWGVFVVSTPNKATYAAGGEAGNNPFHVTEYTRSEFEDLLVGTFPAVQILGQHWIEGMILSPHPALTDARDVRGRYLPRDVVPSRGSRADNRMLQIRGPDGEPPYFIGLCAKRGILDEVTASIGPLAIYGRAVRYENLKEAARRLEREFDSRGEWAQNLAQECLAKDTTIRGLQRELAEIRAGFDERGRWAQRLNGELRQSGAMVERLAEENKHLREALAGRRAGRSKETK
jgi:SAM-dependent methyltransferase